MKFRITRKTQNTLILVGCVLVLALLTGLVLNLYGAFDAKESNPDNLIGIAAIGEDNYPADAEGNTGYGVKVTVDDLGAVTAKGTATADVVYTIVEGVKLEAKEYTFTAGVENVSINGFCIRLHNVSTGDFIYADIDGTFTAEAGTYNVELYVEDETRVNATFYPVLVEGKAEGDFHA